MRLSHRQLILLTVFAIAMGCFEAVLVVHLRHLYYPEDPLTIFPPRLLTEADLVLELAREAATAVMILCVAWLAERGFVRVFAAFVYVFGLWDIFYYVWLKATIGWPVTWGEWDVLYLIPWAWLGPWLTPVVIAVLFVLWGGFVITSRRGYRFTKTAAMIFLIGTFLALAAFLQPALPLVARGLEAFRRFEPGGFWWGLYIPGVLLMGLGLGLALRRSESAGA
ncbi:MAG: hypothetical protein GWO16_01615 [Gammaproteobacteria bacterium]|nr:hypothetical protein [Gammaproteobacteria bacterium]